ncbi:MAG: acetate kinase [Campylobacteraceae bacterium]|jgi:acetate kinase|nr:acetate kinase [Campylobacteraceae bacterium]
MKILVINSGSSSIKFQLFSMKESKVIAFGLIEQIGEPTGKIKMGSLHHEEPITKTLHIKNHEEGIEIISSFLVDEKIIKSLDELDGVGHRVVHGGTIRETKIIDENIIKAIENFSSLAPLHNPPALAGIKATISKAPHVPQVAVFDTAFHQTMPQYAYMYALPYELYERLHIRRYGFHGTSHHFVATQAAKELKKPLRQCNLITLHLGNGASVAAIKNGKCIDTSMGLSPLEGLVMGTRSGDIDPAILFFLEREEGLSIKELDILLNKKSGLKGICDTNDLREIKVKIKDGDERAKLAFDIFCYRIKKYIGAYSAILGRVDALVFTGGIGENAVSVRQKICSELGIFGISINKKQSEKRGVLVHFESKKSAVKLFVIPTNEELAIAKQTQHLIQKKARKG